MIIDGEHNGRSVALEVLFCIGRILYQRECQHEGLATLDGVEVWSGRFGITFHGNTTKATPASSMNKLAQRYVVERYVVVN